MSDVPFNLTYEHTRWFTSTIDQTNYFLSKASHTFTQFTYQREEQAIRVPANYDSLYDCNYVMYQNKNYSGKWFYAFITKKEYVNPEMTKIYFEIDVFQTYRFEMLWNPSFVEREHCQRWNSDGTPIVNTVDEGLMYGTEYDTVSVKQWIPHTDTYFLVIVSKQTLHGGSANVGKIVPTINGNVQPLSYYVHPFKKNGSTPNVTLDGMDINLSSVQDVLTCLYSQTTAVNNIVSLYITDYIGYNNFLNASSQWVDQATIQDSTTSFNTLYIKYMPYYDTMDKDMGGKWTGYKTVTESKLLMYPYTQLTLDDFKGNRANFKTEYINGDNLWLKVKGSIGTSNKVSYGVKNYNTNNTDGFFDEIVDETALINNEPNDVPIITDLLAAYLQGNKNTIANQKSSILFNQVTGAFNGMVNTAMMGHMMGVSGVMQGIGEGVQSLGNGYLQMQGLLAKQQDIANTPPSIAKMGSNSSYTLGNGYSGVYIIKKQIKSEYIKKLTDFFKMYGYKLNEVKIPNLHTRQHFNFVKTVGANIHGDMPNEAITKLKAIFDKGITLWHGDWVCDYSKTNGEI
ncbi:MAG: phage tail protein [Ignavibacteria bacterium]|nr:phage tail protein [Ignavibacteria bacterium]